MISRVTSRSSTKPTNGKSAEVQVEWLNSFVGDLSEGDQGKIADFSLSSIFTSVNAKGYLLTGRYQPYLLVGGGALSVISNIRDLAGQAGSKSLTQTMFAMRFGLGVDVYATKHVVVSVGTGYVLPLTGIGNFEHITVDARLQYRF